MNSDNYFENEIFKDHWLRLLGLVDYCNHAIKQGQWFPEDVKEFYALKDMIMEELYHNPPTGAKVTLKKVPYLNQYNDCKPCSQDSDHQKNILIEMEVMYAERVFCYHIPLKKTEEWGVNIDALEHKEWISSCDFNRMSFKGVFEEIRMLLNLTCNTETNLDKLSGR